jgi:hypothetical protein
MAAGWGGVPDAKPPPQEEAYPVKPFRFDFIPDIWMGEKGEKTRNYFLFGLVAADGWDLTGLGISSIGISNYRHVRGLQLGGVYATAVGNVRGVQSAGIVSYAGGKTAGFQNAGIFSIGHGFSGGQISGLGNINHGRFKGFQSAGIGNINTAHVQGLQLAGIFNVSSRGIYGVQITSIVNWTKGPLNGLQIGLVNRSGKGGLGVQIGLVNFSRNSGSIPVGLVNIVDGGILNPSLWLDSMGFMNLSLKSGSRHFYSHLSTGIRGIPLGSTRLAIMGRNDKNLVAGRIGLGGEIPMGSLFFDIEALCGTIMETSTRRGRINNTLLLEGRLLGGFKFLNHLALFAGISYDYLRAFNGSSPVPSGGIALGGNKRNIHRLGFFGGVQF